jgi:DNA-binding GntR family transcriptional regulator
MTRIQRETVADKSAEVLRDRILRGTLRPGTAVTEDAVADDLGVSRATVRQALNTLMLEGVLTRHPTTRVLQVTQLSDEDVRDIYRARRFLELGGVEAAAHAPPEAFARLTDAVQELEKAVANDDVLAFVKADFRCHAEVVAFLGSTHLSAAHAQLMSKLRLAVTQVNVHKKGNQNDLAVHREFLTLLTAGDTAGARRNLAERFDRAEHAVRGQAAAD